MPGFPSERWRGVPAWRHRRYGQRSRISQSLGLTWPLPETVTDSDLEAKLYKNAGKKQGHRRSAEPDWAMLHREMKRKHVTLSILSDEYIEAHPEGYRYSRFCELYRSWEGKISVTMRQAHLGGDKLFVDYAGDTAPVVIDRLTGEIRKAQIFVAVLGASNFTYAEATWTQSLADWIGAHTRAFEAIGGVTRLLVPDNTKTAIIKACLYEPQVNRTYTEMAAHYGTGVLPARPRRPRDKAKVEVGVLIMERWILGRLRNRQFHSLGELNEAIPGCWGGSMTNARSGVSADTAPTRRRTRSSGAQAFAGRALRVREWRVRRVGIDYHVDVDKHYYSVPHRFARAEVELRLTGRSVEIFARGERIAAHLRLSGNGNTRPYKNTCPPAIGVTPTGRSIDPYRCGHDRSIDGGVMRPDP